MVSEKKIKGMEKNNGTLDIPDALEQLTQILCRDACRLLKGKGHIECEGFFCPGQSFRGIPLNGLMNDSTSFHGSKNLQRNIKSCYANFKQKMQFVEIYVI
jgi:hypothetical protein